MLSINDIDIEAYIKKMPSLRITAKKALELSNNVAISPLDLNQLILSDPILTGRLLQLVSTAYDDESPDILSMVRAITMLGINTVKNLVYTNATLSLESDHLEHSFEVHYWKHSLCTGIISRILAEKQGIFSSLHEEYYIAGFLHDIGMLPLKTLCKNEYQKELTLEKENEFFGTNHCLVGEKIAKLWQFKPQIKDVVMFHHDILDTSYSGKNQNILNTVIIADYLSSLYYGDIQAIKPNELIWQKTGITEAFFDNISDSIAYEIKKGELFLNLC